MVQIIYDNQKNDKDKNEVGLATSIGAGIGSGVFKIFEGAATLGATLLDLGVDKNRAEAVEKYFEKINPFDELAEATAAGKIAELIVNIGVPGGAAFKIGSGLTKATLAAKQAGTYLSKAEKLKRFGKGALAGGVAEGVFVGDVEDAGSFGDLLGGPTALDRESKTPEAELLNRLKFGLEGAGFTGALGAAGRVAGKLKNQTGTGRAITDSFDKWIDKYISRPLRARGKETQEGFEERMKMEGALARDTNQAENAMLKIDKITGNILKNFKNAGNKVDKETRSKLLKEMNDLLMDDGKLNPIFKEIEEISIDPTTGKSYKSGFGELKELAEGTPLPEQFKAIDPNTGQKIIRTTKEIDSITNDVKKSLTVELEPMNLDKIKNFKDKLINNYKANSSDVDSLINNFSEMRGVWEGLFTSMGRRLTPEAVVDFQSTLKNSMNDILDRGYEVFKNSPISVADNYAPTKAIIKETVEDFQKVALEKGITLSDDVAKSMVDEVWSNAELPKGIMINPKSKAGSVRLGSVPDFFLKSVADDLTTSNKKLPQMTGGVNLTDLTGVGKDIIKKLLGKAENPMSPLVEGTNALSSQVRLNEYLDNMVKRSNQQKVIYDKWLEGGRVGPEPRVPFLVDNPGEARKYFGGSKNTDWKIVSPAEGGAIRETKLGRFEDMSAKLKPLDEIEAARLNSLKDIEEITNPVAGKYALTDFADALTDVQKVKKDFPSLLYQNLVLYPKATSQMAKTVLGPFTHMRNFLSASAFAAANGILPLGNLDDVKKAFNSLQLKGFRKDNEFYRELLDLGVVNSNVQIKQIMDLMEDAKFGEVLNKVGADYNGFNTFMKGLKKLQKGAQDAYTAEDDFWKIFTYLGEKGRLDTAYRNSGLRLGQEFVDPNGVKQIFNDEYLKKEAANLVKNNVPNYAFVSDAIKGLRKLPVGNFVAFPAEIIRTGTNIVDTALKEIFYTTTINGKVVRPLAARGRQRLMGMAITTTVLPLGTVAAMQTLYDVSKDELQALRRYVPQWSKNSVLIPFKDKEGNLEYIDFSHLNAYDTLTRPIQTVINAIDSGREDKDGIMGDFLAGLIESTKELGSPFISESIWTQALQDVAPILGRGGKTATGSEIYDLDVDSVGNAMKKSIFHLAEAQAPFNWKQLQRLGMSIVPLASPSSISKFDDRGKQYELGNELLGIAGMRRIKIDPEKSLNYKITDFKNKVRASRNIFTRATLKGGVVTPEEMIDAYIQANKAMYNTNRELYLDLKAADTLGMSQSSIADRMDNRGEARAYDFLEFGDFRPFRVSRDVQDLFEVQANRLGVPNAFESAIDVMERIAEILETTSLDGDNFPNIENPFTNLPKPTLGPAGQLPPVVTGAAATPGFVGQQNVNIPFTQLPEDQKLERIDQVDKLI
jgi:hypothetical protein